MKASHFFAHLVCARYKSGVVRGSALSPSPLFAIAHGGIRGILSHG